jgi:hypothetical protein
MIGITFEASSTRGDLVWGRVNLLLDGSKSSKSAWTIPGVSTKAAIIHNPPEGNFYYPSNVLRGIFFNKIEFQSPEGDFYCLSASDN